MWEARRGASTGEVFSSATASVRNLEAGLLTHCAYAVARGKETAHDVELPLKITSPELESSAPGAWRCSRTGSSSGPGFEVDLFARMRPR